LEKHDKERFAWQRAVKGVTNVCRVTAAFPDGENGLVSQQRRAALAVPSNITEAQALSSAAEFRQFLGHARPPLYEVETQLISPARLNRVGGAQARPLQGLIRLTGKPISGLPKSLKGTRIPNLTTTTSD